MVSPTPSPISAPPFGESNRPLVLKTHCELPTIARGSARHSFAVLVHAKTPGADAAVACPDPDVRVRAVKSSGRHHEGLVLVASGRAALVDIGGLRAGQERRFLLFVNVPSTAHDDGGVTCLVRVSCTYKDVMTGKSTVVTGEDAVVRRPVKMTSQEDQKPSVEIQVERFRMQAAAGPFATPTMKAMKANMVDLSKRYVNTEHRQQQHKSSGRTMPPWATMVMPNNGIGR